MNESKRMTSIARRISRSWLWRLCLLFIVTDIVLCALALGGWCWYHEKNFLQDNWHWELQRQITLDDALPFPARLEALTYTFTDPVTGQTFTVQSEDYFSIIYTLATAFFCFQILLLMGQFVSGRTRAQRLLYPLHKMTLTAQELSEAHFDEQKYHDLENAIARISPAAPEARLHTGDKDLQGLEEAVNSLLTRMHESYRQQIRFVSDASHELRTPIAVIQGYANMLDRWGKNDEKILSESITAIKTESTNMQKLVEQLLFLARGDSGRNKMTFEKIDLSALMQEVYDESVMIDQKHEWIARIEPNVEAYGDLATLKQTARILTDNACKYTPDGEAITLRAYYDEKNIPSFAVQDNGIGIKEGDVPHIFERFFRSDPARSRQNGGTGLGLSIAKWIIDRHDGYFEVLSREQVGTRISVHLPKKGETESPAQNP